jgi:hypothetical protein
MDDEARARGHRARRGAGAQCITRLKPSGALLGHDCDDLRVREAVQAFAAQHGVGVRVHDGTNVWQVRE